MKAQILNNEGKNTREISLPSCFEEEVRKDLIHKVFWTVHNRQRQLYGAYILAGKEVSASGKQSHRRRKWKTLYGKGVSRVPRKTLSHRGEQFHWIGAFIPGTVGGRAAHPPKPLRAEQKINKKENRKAINSAIAASTSQDILKKKYPQLKLSHSLPIVIDSKILEGKAKETVALLEKLTNIELKKEKKIRAGLGKRRGRKYKSRNKVLLIVDKNENTKTLGNYGLDIINTYQLNIMALAPGGTPGRVIVWTVKAIEGLKR